MNKIIEKIKVKKLKKQKKIDNSLEAIGQSVSLVALINSVKDLGSN